MTFILLQFADIFAGLQSDFTRIINFLTQNTLHIFLRKPRAVIFHRNLHIRFCFLRINRNISSRLRIFTGIFRQCIYHEKRQSLIRFHNGCSRLYGQGLLFHLESLTPFHQYIEKGVQLKILYIQTQCPLPHLNP